jgi:hypothetical protein
MSGLKVGRIEQLTHTKGPWTRDGQFIKAGKRIVAEAFTLPEPHLPATANGHLISAAPDLLAELKVRICVECACCATARAAIAKAEGR